MTCELCGELDNKIYKMSEYATGTTAPPFHPWCRCCTAPYFADMEGVGERFARNADGKTYDVPREMTFGEWKEKFVENEKGVGLTNAIHNRIMTMGGRETPQSDNYDMPIEKIEGFLLKPGAKHAQEFFDVGYTPADVERLNQDIATLFDEAKKTDIVKMGGGIERFSIFMDLGVKKKKRFRTVWQKDTEKSKPRFITAHREDG